jgi:Arc/MetJ-type ribon-helix-helix transcriptional regulator
LSKARKRWISAEVEALLVAQLDREAEARGISRSEAIRRALARWTREAMEEDEGRVTRAEEHHRRVMGRLDFLVGMLREQDERIERLAGRDAGPEEVPTGNGPLAEARKRARRTLR